MSRMTAWATTIGDLLAATAKRPNKVTITVGADVSDWLISAYVRSLVGDQALDVDHIGNEGLMCTDAYCRQSCTEGRGMRVGRDCEWEIT